MGVLKMQDAFTVSWYMQVQFAHLPRLRNYNEAGAYFSPYLNLSIAAWISFRRYHQRVISRMS